MFFQPRPASKAEEMKAIIKSLLNASDKTQLPDYPITEEQRQEWISYRQSLRELLKSDFSEDVTLPTPPNS
jgi:hypothetical protein